MDCHNLGHPNNGARTVFFFEFLKVSFFPGSLTVVNKNITFFICPLRKNCLVLSGPLYVDEKYHPQILRNILFHSSMIVPNIPGLN